MLPNKKIYILVDPVNIKNKVQPKSESVTLQFMASQLVTLPWH